MFKAEQIVGTVDDKWTSLHQRLFLDALYKFYLHDGSTALQAKAEVNVGAIGNTTTGGIW